MNITKNTVFISLLILFLCFDVVRASENDIIINMPTPVVGGTPFIYTETNENYDIEKQIWSTYKPSQTERPILTFESGMYIRNFYNLILKPNENYSFPADTKIIINGIPFFNITSGVINDPSNSNYGCLQFKAEFGIASSLVAGTNSKVLPTPIVGSTPTYIEESEEYDILDQNLMDENRNQVTSFESGKTYSYLIYLDQMKILLFR